MEYLIASVTGFISGVVALLAYMLHRIMKNMTDKSNLTNALRLLSHVVLHPHDFGKMYYLTEYQHETLLMSMDNNEYPCRPFWYEDKDELSEVVKTRP